VHAQRPALARLRQARFEFPRQLDELRCELLLRLPLELEELDSQGSQPGAAAPLEVRQGPSQRALPFREQIPDVPVGKTNLARRRRELPGALDRQQQRQQRRLHRLGLQLPGELQVHPH
jgi:hypothetical protein